MDQQKLALQFVDFVTQAEYLDLYVELFLVMMI